MDTLNDANMTGQIAEMQQGMQNRGMRELDVADSLAPESPRTLEPFTPWDAPKMWDGATPYDALGTREEMQAQTAGYAREIVARGKLRGLQAVALLDMDAAWREAADAAGYTYYYSKPEGEAGLYTYGEEFLRQTGQTDNPMQVADRLISQVQNEEVRAVYRQRFDALKNSGDDTAFHYTALVGEVFRDECRRDYSQQKAENEARVAAILAGRKKMLETAGTRVPKMILGDERVPLELAGLLSEFDDEGMVLESITRAQRAGARAMKKLRGGMTAEELEAAIEARVQEMKRAYANMPATNTNLGIPAPMPSDETLRQRARVEMGKSFQLGVTRSFLADMADDLRGDDGKVDELALGFLYEAMRMKAEGEQSMESQFFRNMFMEVGRMGERTIDEVERVTGLSIAASGVLPQVMPDQAPVIMTPERQAEYAASYARRYSPDVEKLRSKFMGFEDTRLTTSDKANWLAKGVSDLGTTMGSTLPYMAFGMAGGAVVSLPSNVNRQTGLAYERGLSMPELRGLIKGASIAGSEGFFGAAFAKMPGYTKLVDMLALKGASLPYVGRVIGRWQGSALGRVVGSIFGESLGELVVEDLVADGVSWTTINGLRRLGVPLDEEVFKGVSERLRELDLTDRQQASAVTFCVLMGLTGAPAQYRAARQFAQDVEALKASGIKPETAVAIQTAARSRSFSDAHVAAMASRAFQTEVLEDPVGAKYRFADNEKALMDDIEAQAQLRDGVLVKSLQEAGIVSREPATEPGKFRVQILDAEKLEADKATWENGKRPEGYETPTKEVEFTGEQLVAFAQYRIGESEVQRMRAIRSQALAESARKRGAADVIALSELGVPALDALAKSEGAITLPVMQQLASLAEEAQAHNRELIAGVSNRALMRLPSDLDGRLNDAVRLGEMTQEDADEVRAGFRPLGASAVRVTGTDGRSRVLVNDGLTTTRGLAEDVLETHFRDEVEALGGEESEAGRAFVRELASDLAAVRAQILETTGEEVMPEFAPDAVELSTLTEIFSHFAQSEFYQTADKRGLKGEALMAAQVMDNALMAGTYAQAMKDGYAKFLGTEAGQAFVAKGGALSTLMEKAGVTLRSIYEAAAVESENLAAVMEARANARGGAEVSIEEVEQLAADVKTELEAQQQQTVEGLEPEESASDDVSTEELGKMFEQERSLLDEQGNIKPQPFSPTETEPDTLGRGLKNGKYVRYGDGSVMGSARVEDIHLSPDVPQFKRGLDGEEAAADGTTHKLSGRFREEANPITLWRRKDGRLEVITGRHRLAHEKANGVQDIAVRVYDESEKHDARWAKLYDVEQNILDKQASAADVAFFFRNTDMTEAEAEERGLMPRKLNGEPMATSTMGIAIARRASEEVFTRFMNGAISADKAYFVATLGASEQGQQVALAQLEKGKPMPWVKAFVHEFEAARAASDAPQQFDLFGFDDSWAKEAEKVASYVAKARKLVGAKLDILKKAGKLESKSAIAKELGITVQTEGDVQRVRESLELLDARLEAMDSDLGIGARAAEWDGKSQVDVDALAKAGGTTFSLALDNGVGAFQNAMDVREEVMERMLNSVKKAAQQWQLPFKGTPDDRTKARGSTLGLMMGIYRRLPQGYRLHVTPLLKRAAVLERMIATGKLTSHGQISKGARAELEDAVLDRLDEEWQSKLGEAEVKFRKDKDGKREAYVTKAEQRRLWKEAMTKATEHVGREGMEGVYRALAAEVQRAVETYLHHMEMARLGKMLERFTPKMNPATRKLNKGKYGAAFYDEVNKLRGIMGASLSQYQTRCDELNEKLAAMEAEGELDAAQQQEKEVLDAELADWMAFGALGERGFRDVRKARALLGDRAANARDFWERRLNVTRAKLQAVKAKFADEAGAVNENKLKAQKERFSESWFAQLGHLVNSSMSAGQLLYTLHAVPGLEEYAIESVQRIAQGNIDLAHRAAQQKRAMDDFLITALGMEKESDRNDFAVEMKRLRDTGIRPLGRLVSERREYTIAEAEAWLAMTPEQRDQAREEWKKNPQGVLKPLPEWATPALQVAYDENMTGDAAWARKQAAADARRLAGKPGRVTRQEHKPKPKFEVEAKRREETQDPLVLSKDQALNIILLSEQPRYKDNADLQGYTDEVLQQLREFVGEEVLSFGYWMRDYIGNTGLAEVFEAREGVPFPAEENYWTGHFDLSGKMGQEPSPDDTSSASAGGRYGMLKTRVNHNLSFDLTLGATNVFMGTLAMQNNYICMGGLTSEWRSLLADQTFAKTLRTSIGESRFQLLKEGIQILDMQGLAEATAQRAVSRLIGAMQGVKAMGLLSGSVYTALKQGSAVMHAASAPGVNFVNLSAQLLADRAGKGRISYGEMLQQEAFAERMAHNSEKYDVYAKLLAMGPNVTYSKLAEVADAGMERLEWIDVRANALSATALYNLTWKKLEKAGGMTEQQMHDACMQQVEIMLDQAMMPTLKGQQAIGRVYGGAAGKAMLFMQGELLNKMGLMVREYHRMGGGARGFFLGGFKIAWTMSMAEGALAVLIDVIRGPMDDEELDFVWGMTHLITAVSGLGFMNNLPVFGEMLSSGTQWAHEVFTGEKQRRWFRTNTLSRELGLDVFRWVPSLIEYFTRYDEWGEMSAKQHYRAIKDSLMGMIMVSGLRGGTNSTFKWWSETAGAIMSAHTLMNLGRPAVDSYDYYRGRYE